jgi:NAD(P)-dependent dehydrogenase (short-subunit alcohol dehydrogenase family)
MNSTETPRNTGILDGRVALVTGAARGVGLGIAQELAQAGASVAVNDLYPARALDAIREIRLAGGSWAIPVPFDVTDQEAVRKGVQQIESDLGPVDILVNNAGIPPDVAGLVGPFKDSDPSFWHKFMDLNFYGSLYIIRTVLPGMVKRVWGRIIQISSLLGSQGVPIGLALYGGSKAGIEGVLRNIAIEEARSGVTVNSVALGLMENVAGGQDAAAKGPAWARDVPMGRAGTFREVGACVVWLCSEKAGWVTGQTIHLNGGQFSGR